MPKRPNEYECNKCGNEGLRDSDVDRVVDITSSPGDVGSTKEEAYLCEKCSEEWEKIKAGFNFQPTEDGIVIL